MRAIRNRTIKNVDAMDAKLWSAVHDFLYLINFVFFSSQLSAAADGALNNMHLKIIPIMLDFWVT